MSQNQDFDRQLRDWLVAEGGRAAPPGLAAAVATRTASRRPRPAWIVALRGEGYSGVAAGRRDPISRPVVLVALVALLVAVLVAGLVMSGASPKPLLVIPTAPPSAPASLPVAIASPTAQPTIADVCGSTSGGWPGPTTPAGQPAAAKPGLLAGWGPVGSGTSISDHVFSLDPAVGRTSLKQITTFGPGSLKETTLAWAPDGSALTVSPLLASGPQNDCLSPVVVAGGQTVRPFPAPEGCYAISPSWSPDGSRLAAVEHYGNLTFDDLLIASRDGSPLVVLPKICPTCLPSGDQAWSPDGAMLATDYQDRPLDGNNDAFGVAFYSFASGTWQTHPLVPSGAFGLSWLDNQRVLLQWGDGTTERIEAVSAGVDGEQAIGSDWAGLESITLSPDRSSILVARETDVGSSSTTTLSVLDLATGASRALPAGGPWPTVKSIVWAPDSSAVVLGVAGPKPGAAGDRSGTWIVPLDGSAARQLSGPEFTPTSWQPVWP
jgi:hypothetical protein